MIDTHCHLDGAAFDGDRAAVLERARAAGVDGILVPAIRPTTWAALIAMASDARAAGVAIGLGVHPQIVPALDADERALGGDPERIARRIDDARAGGAVIAAVGECGLDGGTDAIGVQEQLFRAQIRAARALGLPLIVHVLRAHDRAPRILREERAGEVGGVLHSYSGGAALVGVYRDLGFAFSFAGPITYANARRPIEAARAIPDELILVETDAPDQAPATHRHGRSEPGFLGEIVRALAVARGADADAMAALTAANARRRFPSARWPSPPIDGKHGGA